MKYDKLIRDLIPQKMDSKGVVYKMHIAEDEEFKLKLKDKLQEEVQEYLKDQNTEELADILEVVYALCQLHGADNNELEKLRITKRAERGGFEKRIILDETE